MKPREPAELAGGEPGRPYPDASRRRTLILLALATAVGSVGLAAGGTAGALLGAELAGTEAAAGLPLGVLVVGQAAAAVLVSGASGRAGRGRSLALGYAVGVVGAVLVVLAAVTECFALLLGGSAMLGAGNTAVFLTRYAAAEVAGDAGGRGRALGTVLFAASLGAVAGPNLLGPGGDLARLLGLPPTAGLYLLAIPCFSAAALLLAAASAPGRPGLGSGAALLGAREKVRAPVGDLARGSREPSTLVALAILAATNLVMVAVMAIAPVHMVAQGHGLALVGVVVGIHVAGMFVPSPISGPAADRFGPVAVAGGGFVLIAASGAAGLLLGMESAVRMTAVLLLLGIGWNLGVVGGSALLAGSVPAPLRPRAEGIGEVSMGLAAGAGAPIAGLVVALGGFAALSLAGAVVAATAMLALALARHAY